MRPRVFQPLAGTSLLMILALSGVGGCRSGDAPAAPTAHTNHGGGEASSNAIHLAAGTALDVTLGSSLSSESASLGSAWAGVTRRPATEGGREVIPAGSPVSGTVSGVTPAAKGDRAMLDLTLTEITIEGHTYHVRASMDAVIAGSPRARNLGAIAGSSAAGAVIGNSVAGDRHGTLIGGVLGGLGAAAVVSGSKGWQVDLKAGASLTFITSEMLAIQR